MGLISFAKNAGKAILRRGNDDNQQESAPTQVDIPTDASSNAGSIEATASASPGESAPSAPTSRDTSQAGTVIGSGADRVYVTKDGDTLEAISTYFYGAEVHKQRIMDENPEAAVYNNLRIPAGVRLRVSEDAASAATVDTGAGAEDASASFPDPQAAADSLTSMVQGLGISVENLSIQVAGETATLTGTAATQEDREKAVLVVGNTKGIGQVDDQLAVREAAPEATFYTVQSGDTLSAIAEAHYGDPGKYPAIFEANRPMLEDPDLIYPGQVLRIPAQ